MDFTQSTRYSCQIFNETLIFVNRFSKKTQISNFMEVRPVGAELLHADGRTDRNDQTNSCFSQFCQRA